MPIEVSKTRLLLKIACLLLGGGLLWLQLTDFFTVPKLVKRVDNPLIESAPSQSASNENTSQTNQAATDASTPQPDSIAGYDYRTLNLTQYQAANRNIKSAWQDRQSRPNFDQPDRNVARPDQLSFEDWKLVVRLNESVHHAIVHDDSRRIRLGENWIQWLAGRFYAPLSLPQLPRQIQRRQAGICSDACLVLQSHLNDLGLTNRFVGLSGHVVLEVKWNQSWRMLDPDFGVATKSSVEKLAAGAKKQTAPWDELESELVEKGYKTGQISLYRTILATTEDNHYQAANQPLSPRLYYFAIVTGWLSPAVSLLLLSVGILLRTGRQVETTVAESEIANHNTPPT